MQRPRLVVVASSDRLCSLLTDDDDFVTRCNARAGDVDGGHVHAHRTDHGRASAAHEHVPAAGKSPIESIGVTSRDNRNRGGAIDDGFEAVSRRLARTEPLDVDDTAME